MLARPDVERARVAGLGERDFTGGRAEDRDVPVDRRHAIPRHGDLDDAVASEVGSGNTRRRIERNETWTSSQQNAGCERAVTRPIRNAARGRRHPERHEVAPHLFTCVRLDCEDLITSSRQIHDASDDDRRRLRIATTGVESVIAAATSLDAARDALSASRRASLTSCRISRGAGTASCRRGFGSGSRTTTASARGLRQLHRPCRCEIRDVAGVDLVERGVARACQIAAVERPVSRDGSALSGLC